MKVMFLLRALDYGGAERQLVTLARECHRHGHHTLVTTFYAGGPLEKDLQAAGVPLVSLAKQGRWDMAGFLRRLIHLVQQEQPDVIHGYLTGANILTIAIKPFFPHIRMIWGVRSSDIDLRYYSWFRRSLHVMESALAHFADLIIANSHAGMKYASQYGFPANKIVVIPNGIDTARFYPDREKGRTLRDQWQVHEQAVLVGLVGRLHPKKDHPTFLQAAAQLMQTHATLRFVCIGDGTADYRQTLQDLATQLGLTERLIWAGAYDDMPAVYNALDIAVSASAFGEGFSNAIGEAMACGVPCVATDTGDAAWIVGDMGVVVPAQSPHRMAAAIETVLNERSRLRPELVRCRIERDFSVETLYERTAALLFNRTLNSQSGVYRYNQLLDK